MGWVGEMRGRLVAIDSSPLIYHLEDHPIYADRLDGFFAALASDQLHADTSTITLVEVLTRPLRIGDSALVDRYTQLLLDTRELTTVELSVGVAREAARLRALYNLRTPDAVQLATAFTEGASHFLTNDARLARVAEIDVIVLDELI